MRRAVNCLGLLLSGLPLLLLTVSCQKPAAVPEKWAVERQAQSGDMRAVLRLSAISAVPGDRLDLEVEVESASGSAVILPEFHVSGLELVDTFDLPPVLLETGKQLRRCRWVFQAGPPGRVTNQVLRLACNGTNTFTLELPEIAIHSAFPEAKFTNALPPWKERDAL